MPATLIASDAGFSSRHSHPLRAIFGLLGVATFLSFFALNLFGGIVSGIWLAFKGEWGVIIYGILASIAMPWVFGIALLPSLGLLALLIRKGNPPSRWAMSTVGFTCALWNAAIIASWTLLVFVAFMRNAHPGLVIPLLIWGYSTTMTPLARMARAEGREAIGTSLGLILAVLTYATLTCLMLAGSTMATAIVIVATLSVLEALACTALSVALTPPAQTQT